jgi:phospholipid transport system substrate-binding protein
MTRFIALLITALLPTLAAAQETPEALVKRVTDELLTIIKNDKSIQSGDTSKVEQLAEQKVLPHFDFERMTRLAVGKSWRDASDAQKKALEDEFRTLLVRTYSNSLAAYRNQTIEVKPGTTAATDKESVVKTAVIQQGGPSIPINYSMEKTDSGWKVYDVVIDGASLVTTYRGSFSDQIQKGGIDSLVKALQERNHSAPEPAKK